MNPNQPQIKDFKDLPPEVQAMMPVIIGVVCVVALIGILVQIFFCLSMSKALSRCSERNRLMQPGMVWLLFIPCFNYVWAFFIAIQVPGSLKNEFSDRGREDGSDYGKTLGLIFAICLIITLVLSPLPIISMCAPIPALIYIVTGIIFWVKIAGYSQKLGDATSMASADDDYP